MIVSRRVFDRVYLKEQSQIRLLLSRDGDGNRVPCALGEGAVERLQTSTFDKGFLVRVTNLYRGFLFDMTDEDARAEGHLTADIAIREFLGSQRLGDLNQEVWVVTFQRVSLAELEKVSAPRFLIGRTTGGGDYTTSRTRAMPDEPEAVPRDWEIMTAHEIHERERERERRVWEEEKAKISNALLRLKNANLGPDINKEVGRLERKLEMIDMKLNDAA